MKKLPENHEKDPRKTQRLDTGVRLPGQPFKPLPRTHRDAAEEAKRLAEEQRLERDRMLEPFRDAERMLGEPDDRLEEDEDPETESPENP